MSKKPNDGGPAFPQTTPFGSSGGMTLRDWLAGQALAGWLASFDANMVHPVRNNTEDSTAMACYKMADAMLAEREKGANE